MKNLLTTNLLFSRFCILVGILFINLCLFSELSAQTAGSLDPTFNSTGFVTTSFGGNSQNRATDSLIQPDGKILVVGYNQQSSTSVNKIALVRYNTDGTLDGLFSGGKITTAVGMNSSASAVALQPDGKILVAGAVEILNGNTDFMVVRYNSSGLLDNTFGTNGVVITAVGNQTDEASSIIVQPDGKIVVVGSSLNPVNYDFSAVRYNSDGSLDNSFGIGGKILTPVGDDDDYSAAAVLQPNGKIVVTGAIKSGTRFNFATIRYNSDGSLDTTFAQNGKAVSSIGFNGAASDIVIQRDGKIVVSGRASVTDSSNFIVVRYNSDGMLDNSFGDSGIAVTNIDAGFDSAESLALQTDGKIVVGGTSCVPSSCNLTVIRYNQNGSLDNSFDTDGKVTVPLGSSGELKSSVALQTDGKIVISGTDMNGIVNGDPLDFAVARFLPGGRAKFDFDNDGKSDISVFRPNSGAWYLLQSTAGFAGILFGLETDKLVPADYDGDGKTDVAVYRNGTWYLQRSQTGFTGITFGDSNDIPVPADYNGDGKTDIAVFRPSNGYWYILNSADNQTNSVLFGQTGDKPVAADYDGDGKSDIAVNRNGIWYIQRSQLGFTGIAFGDANDKLVPADYDGDGKTDVAVFRPSNGVWYLQQSTAGFTEIAFGLGTDIPVTADYDGDGKSDLAVVRNGNWYLSRSTQGFTSISFGVTTDRPLPNAFVR